MPVREDRGLKERLPDEHKEQETCAVTSSKVGDTGLNGLNCSPFSTVL